MFTMMDPTGFVLRLDDNENRTFPIVGWKESEDGIIDPIAFMTEGPSVITDKMYGNLEHEFIYNHNLWHELLNKDFM